MEEVYDRIKLRLNNPSTPTSVPGSSSGWTSVRASTLCCMSRLTSRFQAAPVGLISSARGCFSFLFRRLSPAFFLALYYVPSADHAHTVVSYIVKEVTSGSFVRSIHAYGSSGIIILLLLHIGQTILYGSYKGRRELLWLSGCILLALMLGMAFTGYLLPWDEKAYFASAVGTNLIAEVPCIGPPLQQLVRGGEQMGTLTVSRFYVLHVFVLPALLIGFIAAHVFFFRKAGAAGPIKEDPVHPKLPSVPFYPRQVVMDAVLCHRADRYPGHHRQDNPDGSGSSR